MTGVSYGNGVSDTSILAQDANGNILGIVGSNGVYPLDSPSFPIPELLPIDWFADVLYAADSINLYGRSASNANDFVSINKVTRVVTVITNPSGNIIRTVIATSVAGTLLLCSGSSASTGQPPMTVWRSTNYGATWNQVLNLGGGTITDLWMLSDRNFCEGARAWYIAEYNVNSSRTPGGANDAVVIHKSIDQGATWSPAVTFNTSGHQIRHIHAVKYNAGRVFICTGDQDVECAVIAWNEIDNISNTALSAMPSTSPALYGKQANRYVDLKFFGEYAYGMTDATPTDTGQIAQGSGIWRFHTSMIKGIERIDGKIAGQSQRSGYYGAVISSGHVLWIEGLEGGTPVAGEFNLGVWCSNSARTNFERVGVIQHLNTMTGNVPTGSMWQDGDTVYVATLGGIYGKGVSSGTCSFTIDPVKVFNGIRPDTLSPVYWVDPVNGVDAGGQNGYSSKTPWKTLKYALESNRCHLGGRIMLPAGNFVEDPSTIIDVNVNTTTVDPTLYLTIDGAGMNKTKYGLSAAATYASHIRTQLEATSLEFKDMHMTTYRAVSTQEIITNAGASTATKIRQIRSRLGGRDISSGGVDLMNVIINANSTSGGTVDIKMYDSQWIAAPIGAADMCLNAGVGVVSIYAKNSVFDGGKRVNSLRGTNTFKADDCMFFGQTQEPFEVLAAAVNAPALLRPKFIQQAGIAHLLNTGAVSLAGQYKSAKVSRALLPVAVFDSDSVIDPSIAPIDPLNFKY